jgi:hypothetical protein
MREIRNSALKLDKIPNPDGLIKDWVVFAHTINGYEASGGFAECAELAEPGRAKTLTQLRCAFFYVASPPTFWLRQHPSRALHLASQDSRQGAGPRA